MKRNILLKISILIMALMIFACLAGCGKSDDETNKTEVSGYVMESKGGPAVTGTVLTVKSKDVNTQTDSNGQYSLNLEKGTYDIVVDKDGYAQFKYQDLQVGDADITKLVMYQPKIFCSDWEATAPTITVKGITSGQKLSGKVDVEVKVTASHPVSAINFRFGNTLQTPVETKLEGDTLSFTWDTTTLPDGENFVHISTYDINYNHTMMKIPVNLVNNIQGESLPSKVTGVDPRCYTYAQFYEYDLSREQALGKAKKTVKAPANTTITVSLGWDKVEDALGYKVYRAESSDETPELVCVVYGVDNYRFIDNDPEIEIGKTYYYYVSSFNRAGETEKTAGPGVTVLDRFTVNLKTPVNNAGGVTTQTPKFEWEINKAVGDEQVYRIVLLAFNDGKDNFTWDYEVKNTTSVTFNGELAPAAVYQWDVLNAHAGKDYIQEANTYRSISFPTKLKIDPYVGFPGFVTSSENGSFLFTTSGSETSGNNGTIASADGKITVRLKSGIDPEEIALSHNLKLERTFKIGKMNYGIYSVKDARAQDKAIKQLESDEKVSYAEPHYVYKFDTVPDDPDYKSYQYCHVKMQSEDAWNITTGSEDVIMAIIDTGLDGTHPEFEGRVVTGHNFHTDEDVPPGTFFDSYGHGTHVAGIAGATGNNAIGVAGVNWKSKIMPLKVNDEGDEIAEYVIASIPWAVDHGANVMNMSLGSPGYSQALQDAITYACKKDAVVVVSMGNNSSAVVQFPAACQGVVAVGSSNGNDGLSGFSTWGKYISLCAPGENIYSTSKNDHGYMSTSGTSMSTPQVVGAVALIQSIHPDWTIEEIRSQLESTADDMGDAGFDRKTGWGRLNLYKLLSSSKVTNKYGRVRIFVKNTLGTGLDGADVVLTDSSGETVGTVKTDSDGYADFFYVPTGTGYNAIALYNDKMGITVENFEVKVNSTTPEQEISIGDNG